MLEQSDHENHVLYKMRISNPKYISSGFKNKYVRIKIVVIWREQKRDREREGERKGEGK